MIKIVLLLSTCLLFNSVLTAQESEDHYSSQRAHIKLVNGKYHLMCGDSKFSSHSSESDAKTKWEKFREEGNNPTCWGET